MKRFPDDIVPGDTIIATHEAQYKYGLPENCVVKAIQQDNGTKQWRVSVWNGCTRVHLQDPTHWFSGFHPNSM